MYFLLILLRFPFLIIHVLLGMIILLFFPNKLKLKKLHFSIVVIWMKILTLIFGLKIIIKGKKNELANSYASNHVSFLDIMVLNSILPVCFIAKSEIENWPIVGYLTSKSGNLFIKRGHKESSDKMIDSVKEYLINGYKIIFFPEGRIGDGVSIKKFHSKLLRSIAKSDFYIQPVSIRYPKKYPQNIDSDNVLTNPDDSRTLFNTSISCLGRLSTIVVVSFGKNINTKDLDASDIAKLTEDSVKKSLENLV